MTKVDLPRKIARVRIYLFKVDDICIRVVSKRDKNKEGKYRGETDCDEKLHFM